MISYEKAIGIISETCSSLRTESVPLKQLLGRVARAEVMSPESIPPFDNSAMDGFAVREKELRNASSECPVRLKVERSVAAGDSPSARAISELSCCEIMTGAVVPEGYDSVIKVEDVKSVDDNRAIQIRNSVSLGNNIRRAGEDFKQGQPVLNCGTRLGAEHLMALASLGITELMVSPLVKVAVLTTGKELVEPGVTPRPGQIRNSNSSYLMNALDPSMAQSKYFGVVADKPEAFLKTMQEVLSWEPDVVLSTGAVSMGKYDFIPTALGDLGAQILFHRVKIRPGKPVLFAKFAKGPLFFGLPGNPVSTAVGFRFFVVPCLRMLLGLDEEKSITGILRNDRGKPEGLRCFCKAKLRASDSGELRVDLLQGQASFMISPLMEANCWAILDEAGAQSKAGSVVQVMPLSSDEGFRIEDINEL